MLQRRPPVVPPARHRRLRPLRRLPQHGRAVLSGDLDKDVRLGVYGGAVHRRHDLPRWDRCALPGSDEGNLFVRLQGPLPRPPALALDRRLVRDAVDRRAAPVHPHGLRRARRRKRRFIPRPPSLAWGKRRHEPVQQRRVAGNMRQLSTCACSIRRRMYRYRVILTKISSSIALRRRLRLIWRRGLATGVGGRRASHKDVVAA